MKLCRVCKNGEVRSCHPDAVPTQGTRTNHSNPVFTGGMSGEIIVDKGHSVCGKCHGTGLKRE